MGDFKSIFSGWFEKKQKPQTPQVPTTPPAVLLGPVSIDGNQWIRNGNPIEWFGVAWDMFNQPVDDAGCFARIDHFAEHGINLIVTYAGPGLGKPFNAGNEGGPPYTDTKNLIRNDEYWQHVFKRLRYANDKDITVLCSYSFIDQGMLSERVVNQHRLNEELAKWAEELSRYSVILSPASEVEEGGSSAVSRVLWIIDMLRKHTDAPIGYHTGSEKTNAVHADRLDFISTQDNKGINWGRINTALETGKPVLIVENQDTSAGTQVAYHREARTRRGCTFVFTGQSRGLDAKIIDYLGSVG